VTSADAAVVAAAVSGAAAVITLVVAVVLARRSRELRRLVHQLEHETLPLLRDARVVVDQAATEMVRVGDVLESAEAVSATVDSASRLVYRAFSNPVVKALSFVSGARGASRRLVGRGPRPLPPAVAAGDGSNRRTGRGTRAERRRQHDGEAREPAGGRVRAG
jgi:hypothetical protein